MTEDIRYRDLLRYDLTFFSDDPDSKTEEPTSKKISETRKKGQVAKSQELTYALSLIAIFLTMKFAVGMVGERFLEVFKWAYGTVIPDMVSYERGGVAINTFSALFREIISRMLIMVLPFFLIGFLVALFGQGLQFKFQVTSEPLKPKFSKLNPVNGVKRLFSIQAVFNLGLSIVKTVLVFVIAYFSIVDHLPELFIMYDLDLASAVQLTGQIVIDTGIRISFVYLLVGFGDFFFQRWKFKKDIKMTKQEVKDEYKNAEGDPQIKGKQRQKMREVSQRRMMQSVPQADVVITNPTHYAVALRYEAGSADAPVVVAKGQDLVAQKIKDIARENGVMIVENPPLARAIYTTVDLYGLIPPELYEAVASVLALVYRQDQTRGARAR